MWLGPYWEGCWVTDMACFDLPQKADCAHDSLDWRYSGEGSASSVCSVRLVKKVMQEVSQPISAERFEI